MATGQRGLTDRHYEFERDTVKPCASLDTVVAATVIVVVIVVDVVNAVATLS